jgi:hypothetical protein
MRTRFAAPQADAPRFSGIRFVLAGDRVGPVAGGNVTVVPAGTAARCRLVPIRP